MGAWCPSGWPAPTMGYERASMLWEVYSETMHAAGLKYHTLIQKEERRYHHPSGGMCVVSCDETRRQKLLRRRHSNDGQSQEWKRHGRHPLIIQPRLLLNHMAERNGAVAGMGGFVHWKEPLEGFPLISVPLDLKVRQEINSRLAGAFQMSSYMGRCSAEVRFIDYDPSVAWLFVDCTLELSCCPGNGQPPAGQCAMAPFGTVPSTCTPYSTKTRYDTLNPSGSSLLCTNRWHTAILSWSSPI